MSGSRTTLRIGRSGSARPPGGTAGQRLPAPRQALLQRCTFWVRHSLSGPIPQIAPSRFKAPARAGAARFLLLARHAQVRLTARLGFALLLMLAAVALRRPLEADPLTHVLVQLPMLALAGAILVPGLHIGRGDWNRGGWACLILAVFAMAFWMLPRNIDAALADPLWEAAKLVSLPLLVGLPLRAGWTRAHPLLRGVLKAQALSMLGVLAFLYTHAPARLCNFYLAEDQYRLGLGFLATALGLAVAWVAPLFFAASDAAQHQERPA